MNNIFGEGRDKTNDKDLIRAISQECGVSVEETAKVLRSLASNIKIALNDQRSVTLKDLGTFKNSIHSKIAESNPITGETIKYSITHVPEFQPVKGLVISNIESLGLG